jgi:hypothetical protein
MRAKTSTPVSTPHTRAFLAFEQNLAIVTHMASLGGREADLIYAETVRFDKLLRKPRDLTKNPGAARLRRATHRYVERLQTRVERFGTALLWQVVMLVTCVEAYLQDVLSAAASVDPVFMRESEQCANYSDVIAANSLPELANDLRARWARGWLSDGGPTRWIDRLGRMGARGYPDGLAPRLELIWGIRHAVVHAAGVATADFVRRHPGVVKAAGDRLRVGNKDHLTFIEAVDGFVTPTDRYFLARYPSLLAPASEERAGSGPTGAVAKIRP